MPVIPTMRACLAGLTALFGVTPWAVEAAPPLGLPHPLSHLLEVRLRIAQTCIFRTEFGKDSIVRCTGTAPLGVALLSDSDPDFEEDIASTPGQEVRVHPARLAMITSQRLNVDF